MSARDDYPTLRGAADTMTVDPRVAEARAALAEIDRLRALACEVWAWDDGDTLPGRIPELLDALGWTEAPL